MLGDRSRTWQDFYHGLLRLTWPRLFAAIALGFLAINALFALVLTKTGGIANADPSSFVDAFFFSVQTTGTIGYGAMHPTTPAANHLVVVETIVSLVFTALATGLVFGKFSRPTARIMFSRKAVISRMNGVPTLMFRIGNERGNRIVDAQLRAVATRSETTLEGMQMYRLLDLKLVRDRTLSLQRSFTVMHVIDESSPLHGQDTTSLVAQEFDIYLMLVGLDDITMQIVHASHRYFPPQILWNARYVDILSERSDGSQVLDLTKFHDVEMIAEDKKPA